MGTGTANPYENWHQGVVPLWSLFDDGFINRFIQMSSLEDEPLEIATDLPLEALAVSPTLALARLLLAALHENGGAKLTAAGNLNRRFVAGMLERLQWPG